jgi:hypothetical protein
MAPAPAAACLFSSMIVVKREEVRIREIFARAADPTAARAARRAWRATAEAVGAIAAAVQEAKISGQGPGPGNLVDLAAARNRRVRGAR